MALSPDPVLFQAEDLQSTVLVPMDKVDAEALKLAYDPLILTKENYPLPQKLVDASNLFYTNPKVLTTLPVVGDGGVLIK